MKPLRFVAIVSLVYDVTLGVVLLLGRAWLARTFSVPPPDPPIFVELNGLFLIAVGLGYVLPCRRPDVYRGYLWLMGVLLKGGGAISFVADHFAHGSPAAFLLFAASDGALALVTLWALLAARGRRRDAASA